MLHVLASGTCNNNCLFCMEDDRAGRAAHIAAQSPADVEAMIKSGLDADRAILFTSGEPTLNPSLPDYIALAKTAGYDTIALITNGRRLGYIDYLDDLLNRGLNQITFSIHGHTPKSHDAVTRTPGSFGQTRAGLKQVCRRKRLHDLRIHTSTVVTRRTLPHLGAIYRFLAAHPVDLIVLNVMMAKGRGAQHLDTLMPAYPAVVAAVNDLCRRLRSGALERLRVEDVPPCVAAELPAPVRGELEQYRQYEHVGSSGVTGVCASPTSSDLRRDASYYVTSREEKEATLRTHGPPCERCAVVERCPGVWRPYAERFGWEAFSPIENGRSSSAPTRSK